MRAFGNLIRIGSLCVICFICYIRYITTQGVCQYFFEKNLYFFFRRKQEQFFTKRLQKRQIFLNRLWYDERGV